jgi:hypothetical protein
MALQSEISRNILGMVKPEERVRLREALTPSKPRASNTET